MLEEKSMTKFYWAKAIWTTVYIQNQISVHGGKVLAHELYFRHKPNLKHLKVFDNIAYVHVPYEKWKKLDAELEKCILDDYSHELKRYKCYNPRRNLRVSRDVFFDESASWYSLPNPNDSMPITENEANKAKMVVEKEEIDPSEESLISFRLSGPNEELRWINQ